MLGGTGQTQASDFGVPLTKERFVKAKHRTAFLRLSSLSAYLSLSDSTNWQLCLQE